MELTRTLRRAPIRVRVIRKQAVTALSASLFRFPLEYAIKRVQANQEGLKLNGTHRIPVPTDHVNIRSESICTVKQNTSFLSH
jgi:hypothetical protein